MADHQQLATGQRARLRGYRYLLLLIGVALTLSACSPTAKSASADTVISVAVAANFSQVMQELADLYFKTHARTVQISIGSTGALCSQIEHGAPFDVFMAADSRRPQYLVARDLAVADSRRCYATGRLALWDRAGQPDLDVQRLVSNTFDRLVIANPEVAPYGLAAQQCLQRLGIWDQHQALLVRAQSIGQAWQFVDSGAAQIGLVAYAHILAAEDKLPGSWCLLPETMHDPIKQELVIIQDRPEVRHFCQWLCADEAAVSCIRAAGYGLCSQAGG